jgi:outer membrane protein
MKTTSVAVLLVMILAPLAARVGAQARTTLPIALISLQKIATESANAKEATKRLEALRQTKAQEVSAKQKALEDVRLQLANAGGIFRASKRAQLMAEEKRQEAELQRATQQAQADFQNLQRELQADLRRQVGALVTEIAKRRGIQFVLNEDSAVVLAPAGIDLTSEVIERLNAATAQKPAK